MGGPAPLRGGDAGVPAGTGDPLAPYIPRLVVDWLADEPNRDHRTIAGTLVFADISGFTSLTERLAVRGKAGAEEMADLLNNAFDHLLTAAYDFGASLIKWGGDAVLLLFDGDYHAARAVRAASNMQAVMRHIGRLQTSRGIVRLGMSIGVHSGEVDFLLVGSQYRELIVTGPAATATTQMEKSAARGDIVISPQTAALLPAACAGATRDGGYLLAASPAAVQTPNRTPKRLDVDLGPAVSAHVREHLRSGRVDHEHRAVTVGFIEFSGTDDLLAEHGPQALVDAVTYVVNAVQEAAHANDVTILATDLAENGGKIIVTSGVPKSVGDDETRVLSTVRRVVHPGGRLSLRAGITCGSVFAGDYGPFYRRTYSIAGDVVNLAARLMAHGEPGQVLTTPAVIQRSRSVFDTTPLAPFAVKGKAKPVEAVLVGDLRRESEALTQDRLPLIGRDGELAVLIAAAERASRGQGSVVDIVGMPGIGKSRLIEELGNRAQARTLWADGDIYGRATPYQPMQRLLRRTLALPGHVDDALVASALSDLVRGSAPDLLPWLPLIAITAGLDLPPTPEIENLDPQMRRSRLESATSDLLGRLLTMPVMIVMNDVHFMDEATLGLLRRFAADAPGRPWLIVLTRRPTVESPVEPARHVTTIELKPLDLAAAGELLTAATDAAPLPGHRLRQLTERAGGNPLFLTHLVAAATAGADLDALPDSIEGIIAAQIDRLPSSRRRWLRAASVLGMTVDPTWLEAVLAGSDLEDETWTGLEEFIVMNLDTRLHFVHHLVRLTAYEGLPYRRRTELHSRAAEILETALGRRADQYATLLSLHCLHGERYPAAWRYSRLAGDQARAQYALSEAAECYRRAITAAKAVPSLGDAEIADVYEALAEVNMDLGEMLAAEQALRNARHGVRTEPQRLARLCLTTARQRHHVGDHAGALRWATKGRAQLRGADRGPDGDDSAHLLAELAEFSAQTRYDEGNYAAAFRWASEAVLAARATDDNVLKARTLAFLIGQTAMAGQPVDESHLRQADELLGEADLRGTLRIANALGVWAYFAGRWNEALAYYEKAEQASSRIGRDYDTAGVAANRAEVLIQQGRIDEADAVLGPSIRALLAATAKNLLPFTVTLWGRIALARGQYDEAMDKFGEARALSEKIGAIGDVRAVEALAAECHVRAGEPGEALALADQTWRAAGKSGHSASIAPQLHRVRGEALLLLGQPVEAAGELRAALAASREHDTSFEIEATLRTLLRLDMADSAEEAARWRAEQANLAGRLGIQDNSD